VPLPLVERGNALSTKVAAMNRILLLVTRGLTRADPIPLTGRSHGTLRIPPPGAADIDLGQTDAEDLPIPKGRQGQRL
jgi:hypothetical protein